jgi:hypothetical protein
MKNYSLSTFSQAICANCGRPEWNHTTNGFCMDSLGIIQDKVKFAHKLAATEPTIAETPIQKGVTNFINYETLIAEAERLIDEATEPTAPVKLSLQNPDGSIARVVEVLDTYADEDGVLHSISGRATAAPKVDLVKQENTK